MAKFCGLCDMDIHGETWDLHNGSALHKQNTRQRECSVELEMEGGWDKVTQSHLLVLFGKFGPVVKINMSARQYPPAGLGVIEFCAPSSVKQILGQTFYMVGDRLLKVTRWLPIKQKLANEELTEREKSLASDKERRFQEDLYNTVKLAATTEQQVTQLAWMQEWTAAEQKLVDELREDLEHLIQSYIPEAKVHLIGLASNGLGGRGCDMTFELALSPRVKKRENLPPAPPLPHHLVQQLSLKVVEGRVDYESLRESHKLEIMWFIFELINRSNLSLKLSHLKLNQKIKPTGLSDPQKYLSFRYLKMQLNCGIQVKISESIDCYITELTRFLVKLDVRVRALYLALSFWAKKLQLLDTLGSEGLFLMLYVYLQNVKPPVLPSVEALAELTDVQSRLKVRNYTVSFCDNVDKVKAKCLSKTNSQPLAELLQGFFRYYTKFDLGNRIFCPRTGKGFNMLKFRNMKKIMPTFAKFSLGDRQLHIQDMFRPDFNIIKPCSVAYKHAVCAEIHRAEILTRGPVNSWTLLSIIPEEPMNRNLQLSSTKHIKIPFIAATLPEGFLAYKSYSEAENQWYQWLVEITMRCLKVLRITYSLEGDYGEEGQNSNKRQLLEESSARKKGNWSTFLDVERAQNFERPFEPSWDMVQESRLLCVDKYNLWKTRSPRINTSKYKHMGVFEAEERITERQIEELASSDDQITEFRFQLNICHVKSVNETRLDICGQETTLTMGYNRFFSFFQEFVGRRIGAEINMDMMTMFDTS